MLSVEQLPSTLSANRLNPSFARPEVQRTVREELLDYDDVAAMNVIKSAAVR